MWFDQWSFVSETYLIGDEATRHKLSLVVKVP